MSVVVTVQSGFDLEYYLAQAGQGARALPRRLLHQRQHSGRGAGPLVRRRRCQHLGLTGDVERRAVPAGVQPG